jgi:phosphatidylserine decarboxylase
MKNLQSEWFVALQRLLPQHGLSRLGAKLAEAKTPWLKNLLIKQFIRTYNINLDEVESSSLDDYPHFNAFFTRALKDGVRPIDPNDKAVVCPADGTVSQLGAIQSGDIFQAKGHSFSTDTLLGTQAEAGTDSLEHQRFLNGDFITIYLSPRDYHRVHMPIKGDLLYSRYIPGKLFSVNDTTTRYVDGLFAKNERLVTVFDTPLGHCAVILVGAMMVAGIESVWHGHYQPKPDSISTREFTPGEVSLEKGAEMGRFKFGSTVILMFEPGRLSWSEQYQPGAATQLGRLLATAR